MKLKHTIIALAAPFLMKAQQVMTPEILWTLNKFSVTSVEPSHAGILYSVGKVDLKTEKTNRQNFYLNFEKIKSLKWICWVKIYFPMGQKWSLCL